MKSCLKSKKIWVKLVWSRVVKVTKRPWTAERSAWAPHLLVKERQHWPMGPNSISQDRLDCTLAAIPKSEWLNSKHLLLYLCYRSTMRGQRVVSPSWSLRPAEAPSQHVLHGHPAGMQDLWSTYWLCHSHLQVTHIISAPVLWAEAGQITRPNFCVARTIILPRVRRKWEYLWTNKWLPQLVVLQNDPQFSKWTVIIYLIMTFTSELKVEFNIKPLDSDHSPWLFLKARFLCFKLL